jgi:putative nucleotidyltransferase with HDIG domain
MFFWNWINPSTSFYVISKLETHFRLKGEILQNMAYYTLSSLIQTEHLSTSESVKLMDGTIMSLWFSCEAWDSNTAYHQNRTASLAQAIAGEMDITAENERMIYMAALVHDIGKMALPRQLLNKPTCLSDDEYREIQKHCSAGYATLMSMGVIRPIAEAALQHHERVDGSGYPDGVRDSDLTLEARIISVADVVEAMTSHRPYRASLSLEVALAEIVKNRGILYDTNVVDACLRLFMQGSYIYSRLAHRNEARILCPS